MSINVVALTGRLAADPELKTTPSGVSVMSFAVAVDGRKDKEGNKQTNWIDCVAWRQTAEFIGRYFNKGSMIGISGELQTRSYTDKNDNKRKAVEVVVNQASFVESKGVQGKVAALEQEFGVQVNTTEDMNDLPF